jgi:dephospho-CoA kinase
MLRIGLTGDLGSGKSTVARMLAERGAIVLSSDEMGRALMQPGTAVFAAIVERFGSAVLLPEGTLDRAALARLAFNPAHPRVDELNAIVHPAVIEAQSQQVAALAAAHPDGIVVVESALIFTTPYAPAGSWHTRFDRVLMVVAPEAIKIARFIERSARGRELSSEERASLEADARRRLHTQRANADYISQCTVLHNDGDIEVLEQQVDALWRELLAASHP